MQLKEHYIVAGQDEVTNYVLLDPRGGWTASNVTRQLGPIPIRVMVSLGGRGWTRETMKEADLAEALAKLQGWLDQSDATILMQGQIGILITI